MADGYNRDGAAVDAIPDDIAAISKVDQPVSILLWKIVNLPSDTWYFAKRLDALNDRFCSTLGRRWILRT